MRWLADECLHAEIVRYLRASGHDVVYAAEVARQTSDRALADQAAADGRILLTEDKDFGEIVFAELRKTLGIVLLRIPPRLWAVKCRRLQDAITSEGDALYARYTVIDETRTRSQPLPGD
ncbi:MAG: DUF5615 family PIN-like protein [Rhizomicrobium sp.]